MLTKPVLTSSNFELAENALLEGFGKPIGELNVEILNIIFRHLTNRADQVFLLGSITDGFSYFDQSSITSDQYVWYCQLVFNFQGGGSVAILFPWITSSEDVKEQRSIAVYARNCREGEIFKLILDLSTVFFWYYTELPE